MSPPSVIIRNGTCWLENGPRACDLRIAGGKIAEVGAVAATAGHEAFDASGFDVIPGLVDLHVHVDDEIGGFSIADSFASASTAAIRSGVTTFFTFITQRRGETFAQAAERQIAKGRAKCHCDFGLHLTPTSYENGWEDDVRALHARGLRSLKLYTTYRDAGLFVDYTRIQKVMTVARDLDMAVLVHCEDQEILDSVVAPTSGFGNAAVHGEMRPVEAELIGIEKTVYVGWFTKCRTHVVHVSTEKGVSLVERARSYGGRVTCETAPHYVLHDEGRLAAPDGHRWLCTPPLRPPRDRAGVEAALLSGAIDVAATDHCPFSRGDKDCMAGDYRAVPNGLPGIGALVPLVFEFFKARGGTLKDVVRVLALNPAKVAGVYPRKGVIAPGSDADLVIVRRDGPARAVISTIADCHDPHAGRTTTLHVRAVFLGGEKVVEDNRITRPETPAGRCLWEM